MTFSTITQQAWPKNQIQSLVASCQGRSVELTCFLKASEMHNTFSCKCSNWELNTETYYREETITAGYVYTHMLPRIPLWPDPVGAASAILIRNPGWGLVFMSRKDSGRRSQALPIKHNLSGGSGCSQVGSRWARQQIAVCCESSAAIGSLHTGLG